MTSELQTIVDGTTVERVLLHGDLQRLNSAQKVAYYSKVCESLGLNPFTRPFEYIILNGKEQLYAKREATEQLRKIHHVSLTIAAREIVEDTYLVTARATLPDGRTDESIGAKSIGNLKGEARANAMMTAETKAKRRVTLSICGLGMLDDTEINDIPAHAIRQVAAPVAQFPVTPAPAAAAVPDESQITDDRQDAPAPAAADDLPDGYVRIVSVSDGEKTRNPHVFKFRIILSTGEEVSTINTWLASLAKNYQEANTPVRPKILQTKYGPELKALATADTPPDPEPIPIDSDIPF